MIIDAKLYDGVSSKEHSVKIEFTKDGYIKIADFNIYEPISNVKISTRLGNTPRLIEFKNGIRCKSEQNDKIDEILKIIGHNQPIIHKLERSWKLAIISFVAMFAAIVFFLTVGADYTANFIASITPRGTLDYASKNALAQLDKTILHKSNLTKDKQEKIKKLFKEVTNNNPRYKLHFRSAPSIGPNAFALPSGDIVILDELVLLDKDKELRGVEGVLAHEMGHVVYRHTLKGAVKSAIASAIIGYITSDITFLATTIPTVLVTTGYSRKFEAQADDFAIKRMKQLHKSTKPLANLFIEMEKYIAKRDGNDTIKIPSWISTHPSTKDRIKKFNKN